MSICHWAKATLARVAETKIHKALGGALFRSRLVGPVCRAGFAVARVGSSVVLGAHDAARNSHAGCGAFASPGPPTSALHVGSAAQMVARDRQSGKDNSRARDMALAHYSDRSLACACGRTL